jgi:formylmethanofuran dehydrogenase subunit B
MPEPATPDEVHDVTCPFCGLACDDLVVSVSGGRIIVRENGCGISIPAFEGSAPAETTPRVGGRGASLSEAAAEAARLLRWAREPLFAGLATDVAGARAVAQLAERCGGILDHMNSTAGMRNMLALQDRGWITTTLAEVRNRADFLVVAGSDIGRRFPRFYERCLANRATLFSEERRCEIVFLGAMLPEGMPRQEPPPRLVPCDASRLHEAFAVLRALVAGRTLEASEAAGAPIATWRELADRMLAARYGVIAWAAADFDVPHAELTVLALSELVKDLNRTTRFSGLPLGGSDGDITADAVHIWQTGFGSRTGYGGGHPEYDPYHLSIERLLARGEADVLLWVSAFDASRRPPASAVPTVVLGRSGMIFEQEPAVFIPVGIPGLDHAGHMFRTDRVVALPLRRLRPSALPSVAEAAAAIEQLL